ncbi:MAG: hypothetical protein J0I07_07570 [Myxococcales bacterium]|nr:hypothetical protein [Myxococcales bacterium]
MRLHRMSSCGLVMLLALSCSGTPEGTISIVTGEETDVFTRAPAAVTPVPEKIATDGTRTETARAELPVDTVKLGDQQRTDVGALAIAGLDATGATVVRGETLFVQWGALQDATLEVFVQRTGELARMPRGPAAFDPTAATMIAGRYVLAANGTATMIYDLLALKPLASSPVLPRPAKSLASVGTAVLVIDDEGATTFYLSDGSSYTLEPPTGGTFREIAGGSRVEAPDGTQYIVGATRLTGGPTARVFVIDPEGKGSFAGLTAPREGACATFVEGRGLVVIGGDQAAAGAEVLAPGASLATPLPFPADPVKGCGATTLDPGHVAVAGGSAESAPVRVLDLACTTGCAPAAWPDTVPLVRAEALTIAADAAFILGDDASGATHAYRASATGTREIPLRVPRRGARLLPTATGAFTVIGGAAGIEQYLD